MIKVIFERFNAWYFWLVKNVILIIASVFILTKPIWPVVDYVINYDYIVNVLCENKNNLEIQCNGKCHLTKELAKEAGAEDNNPFNKTSKTEITQLIISEDIKEYIFVSEIEIYALEKTMYKSNLHSFLFTSKILEPPRLG